jgi:hypothetical protein
VRSRKRCCKQIAIAQTFPQFPEILAASFQHGGNNCLDILCSGFCGTGVSPVFPEIAVEQFYYFIAG